MLIAGTPRKIFNGLQFLRVLGAEAMATDDFFRARLDGMVDPRHPLAVLARKMPWAQIESALAPAFAHKDRNGRAVAGADMFGPPSSTPFRRFDHPGSPRSRWLTSTCSIRPLEVYEVL